MWLNGLQTLTIHQRKMITRHRIQEKCTGPGNFTPASASSCHMHSCESRLLRYTAYLWYHEQILVLLMDL